MQPIEVIFTGKDETKAAVASVKDGLESIAGSSTQTNEQLANMNVILGSQEMRAWKDAAVDAFKTAGAAVGEFVTAAAEAELVGVRMEATMKALGDRSPTTSKQINELADELSKLTGFDDEALVEAQATLARMGSVSEQNFERATRAAVDLSAATGMDLQSAFQKVGMAMQNADFGRLARDIGDLPPEMQEAAKAALKMGDTLKVQEIILAGIEAKVEGGGEALGETFTGQMNKLRTEYGNFQESVGTPLISLFEGLPGPIKTAGFAIYSLGGQFGPVLSSVADLAIATRGLNAAIGGQGLIGLLGQVRTLGATAFGPMLIQLGLVAIAVAAIAAVWMQWNEQIVKTNKEGAAAVEGAKNELLKGLQASGKSPEEVAKEYRAAQQRIRDELDKTNPVIRAFIFNQDKLIGSDEDLRKTLLEMTGSEQEANRIMKESGEAAAVAGAEVQKTANSFNQSGLNFREAMMGIDASARFDEWADGVGRFGDEIRSTFEIGGEFDNFMMGLARSVFGGLNDASIAAQQLVSIVGIALSQLGLAIKTGVTQFWNDFKLGWSLIILDAIQASTQLVAIAGQLLTNLWNSFRAGWRRIVDTVRQFWSDVRAAFQRIIDDAKNWGLNIVNGIWTGIVEGWAALKAKIEALAQDLPQWIKDALNITSPSKVMAKQVGLPIAQGIGLGFQEGMKKIKPMFDLAPASIGLTPAPAYAYTRASAPAMSGNGGATISGNTFQFYSPLTHDERRIIRREQEDAAQREVLRSLR